jgi:hypothetical protein
MALLDVVLENCIFYISLALEFSHSQGHPPDNRRKQWRLGGSRRKRSFAPDSAQPEFKAWLAQIADLDCRMKENIERRKGQKPDKTSNSDTTVDRRGVDQGPSGRRHPPSSLCSDCVMITGPLPRV